MAWPHAATRPVCEDSLKKAEARQQELTKPRGSLGRLEALAVQLAALQGSPSPAVTQPYIGLFAADHGVIAEGVSAFPQAVTGQMLANFADGGAAISVLARALPAPLVIVNMGIASETSLPAVVKDYRIAAGTNNICKQPAMTAAERQKAMAAGRDVVDSAAQDGMDLFIGGEMGIGNTTSASALAAALLAAPAAALVGRGSGVDDTGLQRKRAAVDQALRLHGEHLSSPEDCLARLGGFEIAALAGAYIRCAQRGIGALVDGFICSVAALLAVRMNAGVAPWLLFAHESAEPGHQRILEAMNAKPILSLGMRLGEASGAAVAVPIIRLACALHNQMASFAGAGVSPSVPHEP